ncbi:MAG: hypothetical protein E3J36_01295 [Candidatus Nealsonbacteria bacterium]|nr:MAG: hypothetical protein E3J36_01295 [Candidatus Nealsonbacteria bacterium]
MRYACIASAKGGARCRATVEKLGTFCSFHQKLKEEGRQIRLAPKPDVILVRFYLNLDRSQKLEMTGIPRRERLTEVEREEKHINHAKQYGRDPYRYRDKSDSGTPIFGKEGINDLFLSQTWAELKREGYHLTDIHLKSHTEKKDVLVAALNYKASEIPLSKQILDELDQLLSSCWGYVRVWADPPNEEGKVIHTVNSSFLKPDTTPQLSLYFNHGLWAIEPP